MTEDLADREAIRVLMARYNINGDRNRIAELAATFAEDGALVFSGVASVGRAAIVERLSAGVSSPGLTVTRHHLTTSLIELGGDTARGRSYFQVLTDIGLDHHGVYVDRFQRTSGAWFIAHREVRIDWQAEGSLFSRQHVRGRAG